MIGRFSSGGLLKCECSCHPSTGAARWTKIWSLSFATIASLPFAAPSPISAAIIICAGRKSGGTNTSIGAKPPAEPSRTAASTSSIPRTGSAAASIIRSGCGCRWSITSSRTTSSGPTRKARPRLSPIGWSADCAARPSARELRLPPQPQVSLRPRVPIGAREARAPRRPGLRPPALRLPLRLRAVQLAPRPQGLRQHELRPQGLRLQRLRQHGPRRRALPLKLRTLRPRALRLPPPRALTVRLPVSLGVQEAPTLRRLVPRRRPRLPVRPRDHCADAQLSAPGLFAL